MTKIAVLTVLAVFMVFYSDAGFAQSSAEVKALAKEVQALKAGQASMQKDLLEIKKMLQDGQGAGQARQAPAAAQAQAPGQAPSQSIILSLDGAPFKGDKNAKVTMVEFTDFQCPFCARHFSQVFPEIEKEYIKTGKVKYVLRDFPLVSIHPNALKAAEAASCAGDQKKYWEMHDRLFSDQKALGVKDLPNHAQALGLDAAKFQQCLDSGKYADKVRKSASEGQNAGITGTPSFFFGLTDPKNASEVKTVKRLVGAQPYAAFKEAIDSLLSAQN